MTFLINSPPYMKKKLDLSNPNPNGLSHDNGFWRKFIHSAGDLLWRENRMDVDRRILDIMEDWLRDGNSNIDELADVDDASWTSLIESKLSEAEKDLTSLPDAAFSKVLGFLNFMSSVAKTLPHITTIISSFITRIKKILESVAKALGVTSYSISVGVPFYLNFSMNFS